MISVHGDSPWIDSLDVSFSIGRAVSSFTALFELELLNDEALSTIGDDDVEDFCTENGVL